MNTYKPYICFNIASNEIEDKIALNEMANIIFINHGKEMMLPKDKYSSVDFVSAVRDGTIYEFVIEAVSDYYADEIVDLFNGCLALVEGAPPYDLSQLITNIHYNREKPSFNFPTYRFEGSDAVYHACKMLKNAVNTDILKIAILKFNVSHEIFYLYPMDLEPFNDTYNYQYLLSRQIKMGYSIIVSYSILEELNLHVKASKDRPSSIDGKWNTDVTSDLENRLSEKGIFATKKIPWLSRSTRNRPFKKEISSCELCEWSDGKDIRDFEIGIIEAILEISYIRSQIASHSNGEKVTELCLYDVENANMLVRSILCDLLSIP